LEALGLFKKIKTRQVEDDGGDAGVPDVAGDQCPEALLARGVPALLKGEKSTRAGVGAPGPRSSWSC